MYGRVDGATLWGSVEPGIGPGTFSYAMGIFRGLRSSTGEGPNQGGNVLTAARFTYNFLNPEKNPGYYTAGTYYGKAGDILALAFGMTYQKDGAGSLAHRSDFLGFVGDMLFEKVLPQNMGVLTANAEYKQFYANYSSAAFNDKDCFCMFDGKSWTVTGLYLIPTKIGIGQFQPYGRYTSVQPNRSSNRDEIEAGLNYIIDGFNAAAETKVNVIATIDHNAMSGISRTSREIMSDIVILGWPQKMGFMEKLMGENLKPFFPIRTKLFL